MQVSVEAGPNDERVGGSRHRVREAQVGPLRAVVRRRLPAGLLRLLVGGVLPCPCCCGAPFQAVQTVLVQILSAAVERQGCVR